MSYKKINSGFLPFVQKEQVTSPFTDIQNRAKVDASLKCIMGNERIHVNSLRKLTKESGPNGEVVYEPDNGDSRVRFVGSGWNSRFDANGLVIASSVLDDYVEVTFYGTGLNMLCLFSSTNRDFRATIDGGAEGSNIAIQTSDSAIPDRNYKQFIVTPITSDLSLGWHTVKIRNATAVQITCYGFEIVNKASQITVKSGKAHGNGYEYEVASDQLIDYNTGFDNVLDANVGTNGGRVIVYIDPADGLVKKRLTKVDAAPAYLGSVDHSNEAIYRKIHFREFGRLRADDVSTIDTTSADVAFTLDDGTTTLVGDNVVSSNSGPNETMGPFGASGTITLTFVGTGLDLVGSANDNLAIGDVYVDGVNVGGYTRLNTIKIASGLPYGTHTVKIDNSTLGATAGVFSEFVIYQPKKPTLPEGAVELADYNLMADFVQNTTPNGSNVSQGVISKSPTRELMAKGSGLSIVLDPSNNRAGNHLSVGTTLANSVEFVFWGTGFDYRYESFNSKVHTLYLDDLEMDVNNYPALDFNNEGTGGFTLSNGNMDNTVNVGQGSLTVKNLPLGLHKFRLEVISPGNTGAFYIQSFNIITPIHSPHTTFGSLSMKDLRNFDSQKDVNKEPKDFESNALFDGAASIVQSSRNVSQILKAHTGWYIFYLEEVHTDGANLVGSNNDGYARDNRYAVITQQGTYTAVGGNPANGYLIGLAFNKHDGVYKDGNSNMLLTGTLQKDELEE